MRRSFHAVRFVRGSDAALRAALAAPGPVAIVMNHASWWDPLIGLWLNEACAPRVGDGPRPMLAPMQMEQLRTFSFFRKLGVFGIDPDAPDALDTMVAYLHTAMSAGPANTLVSAPSLSPVLWITPQGEFADIRTPVRIRPGVAAAAARLGVRRICALACEIVHWTDKRPELLVRSVDVPPPLHNSTSGWTRAITTAMQENAHALATAAMTRAPESFTAILGGDEAKVHPVFDLYLRLRGRSAAITPAQRLNAREVRS